MLFQIFVVISIVLIAFAMLIQGRTISNIKRIIEEDSSCECDEGCSCEPEEEWRLGCELDFKGMKVVAIERLPQSKTVIGYWKGNDMGQYHLYITDEEHENLLARFREYLAEKEEI